MKIGQFNMRRSPLVGDLLMTFIQKQKYDVLMIQDPPRQWLLKNPVRGFELFMPSGLDSLVIILVRSCWQASQVGGQAPRVCVVEVGPPQDSIFFVSGYVQPVSGVGIEEIGFAIRELAPNSRKCLGIDGNGHSPVWGPSSIELNNQGVVIESLLASEELFCINATDSPPTFVGDTGVVSWIDVSAVSLNLLPRVSGWHVVDDAGLGSDHSLLGWTISSQVPQKALTLKKNWKKADWARFRAGLSQRMSTFRSCQLTTTQNLEAAIDQFMTVVNEMISVNVPDARVSPYSRSWWTPEIQDLRQQLKQADRRWRKRRTLYHRAVVITLRRQLRQAIRCSKVQQWRLWCASFTQDNPWQLLRAVQPRMAMKVEDLQVDDQWITDDAGKAAVLTTTFFPQLPPESLPWHHRVNSTWKEARPPTHLQAAPVTCSEVYWACFRMRTKAAPGDDQLPVEVFKQCFPVVSQFLQRLFTASIQLGFFPSQWKIARVLTLRKPGKKSYSVARSYRPISLLNHMGKMLETLVNRRLYDWLEKHQKISPFQWGFRSGRQSQGACWRLVEAVTSALRSREQIQAVALDLQAAYDSVWQNGLMAKMQKKKVPSYLIHWIRDFLSRRRSRIQVGTSVVECSPQCGLPQGSPLSPTLFLIYIDDLLEDLTHIGVSCQAFADDVLLWQRGDFRSGQPDPLISAALIRVDQWAEQWMMTFNPSKCEAICFRGPRIPMTKLFQVALKNGPIPTVGTIKYLGIWFDQHLLWHTQVREATAGARRLLWELRRIVGTRWGASPAVMLTLVRQVLLPKLFYGAECWATVVRSDRFLRSIDLVLGQCARLALGLDRFCPTETALTVANLMPARLQVMQSLCRYMLRHCVDDLIAPGRVEVPQTFLLPTEIGHAWFWRSIQTKGLVSSPSSIRCREILPAIRKGLLNEWTTRWRAAPEVAAAQAAFPAVGRNYFMPQPRDRSTFSTFLRFLTSDVFLGTLHLPRDDWYDSMCPICGDELSRAHILLTCPGLAIERSVLTRQASMDQLSDWNWIVRKGERSVSRFLGLVQRRFADAGSLGVRSSELVDISSRVGLDVLGD